MDVVTGIECLDHVMVTTQVSHDTQLYLAVIGGEEQTPLIGNECLAYLLAVIVAHRDVLQIGIAGTETPCCRHRLIVGGVDMSCLRIDELRKGIDIGRQQFLVTAIVEYLLHDDVLSLQALQHFLGCDILPRLGLLGLLNYLQSVEQHLTHLFR